MINKKDLKERITKLNPKDFGDKFISDYKRETVNFKRGIERIMQSFGRRTTRTKEEAISIIGKLGLIKSDENPEDILKGLNSAHFIYVKRDGILYDSFYFYLNELENGKGEKIYQVRTYGHP